jgi:hypothetical protein
MKSDSLRGHSEGIRTTPAQAEFFGSTDLVRFPASQNRRFIYEAEDFVVFSPFFIKI